MIVVWFPGFLLETEFPQISTRKPLELRISTYGQWLPNVGGPPRLILGVLQRALLSQRVHLQRGGTRPHNFVQARAQEIVDYYSTKFDHHASFSMGTG